MQVEVPISERRFSLSTVIGPERLQVLAIFVAELNVSEENGWEITATLASALVGGESVLDLLAEAELEALTEMGQAKLQEILTSEQESEFFRRGW